MASKRLLCNACGRYSVEEEFAAAGRFGRMVDTQDGEGPLWTCNECWPKSVPEGKEPVFLPTPAGWGDA